jgi:hypothetical protein
VLHESYDAKNDIDGRAGAEPRKMEMTVARLQKIGEAALLDAK